VTTAADNGGPRETEGHEPGSAYRYHLASSLPNLNFLTFRRSEGLLQRPLPETIHMRRTPGVRGHPGAGPACDLDQRLDLFYERPEPKASS
jgi:hypothetical protein